MSKAKDLIQSLCKCCQKKKVNIRYIDYCSKKCMLIMKQRQEDFEHGMEEAYQQYENRYISPDKFDEDTVENRATHNEALKKWYDSMSEKERFRAFQALMTSDNAWKAFLNLTAKVLINKH